jgi:hypothetical protein
MRMLPNPNRGQQLHLLGAMMAESCARCLNHGVPSRVLGVGIGRSQCAEQLLDAVPPRVSLSCVEQSAADIKSISQVRRGARLAKPVLVPSLQSLDNVHNRMALGLPKDPSSLENRFACAVMAEVLHDADELAKRRALGFARAAISPNGSLLIWDRFALDLDSPLTDERASLWEHLHPTPVGTTPYGAYVAHLEALAEEREVARQAAARKGRSLAVGSWDSPQQCEALCRELGFHAEVLFTSFDRFLLAARPRPEADGETQRRHDFEAWRDAKMDTLSERIRVSKKPP